jgi:hypothetical protein
MNDNASWKQLLRLWTLRRPGAEAIRPSTQMCVSLSSACLLLWLAFDWWSAGPEPQLAVVNLPLLAWYALAILALAALLRRQSWPVPAYPSALLMTLGLVPVLILAAIAALYLEGYWLLGLAAVVGTYSLRYLLVGLRAITGEAQHRAALTGVLLLAGFLYMSDTLNVIPDVWTPVETQDAPKDAGSDAESLLFEQQGLIDAALAALPTGNAGPQSFFLGFAGVGDERVFAQEIGLASRVLGERFRIDAGLSLINDERDLDSAPLASVTGLKYALRGLSARMNPERDVLFLSISSHGAEGGDIVVSNAQLPLNDLRAEDLVDALEDSGIKWRVIIISACYAGAFIDALKNPQTIIITAAAADRTSFGCSNDRDLTYFGEAFYRDALPGASSLRSAFDSAKTAIAARESREHVEASNPQAYFGAELEAKLAAMSAVPDTL